MGLRMGTAPAALAAVLALAVGGCGGDDEVTTGGPGTYTVETMGAKLALAIPARDGVVARAERYRTAVGGEATSWGVLSIDNSDGEQAIDVNAVTAVTRAGEEIELDSAWQRVGDWQELVDIDADTAIYGEGVQLYNSMLEDDEALPGAKTEQPYAFDGDPAEIDTLFVSVGSEQEPFGERVQLELE